MTGFIIDDSEHDKEYKKLLDLLKKTKKEQ